MSEHKRREAIARDRVWALTTFLAYLAEDEIARVAGKLSGGEALRLERVVRGFAPDLQERDTGTRPPPYDERDSHRLDWCVNRSVQVFRRETPEKMVMLAYFPLKQDGFIAGGVEGRDVPVHTQSVRLADFDNDTRTAVRFLIDREMRSQKS